MSVHDSINILQKTFADVGWKKDMPVMRKQLESCFANLPKVTITKRQFEDYQATFLSLTNFVSTLCNVDEKKLSLMDMMKFGIEYELMKKELEDLKKTKGN